MAETAHKAQTILANLQALIPDLESVYKDIHSNPELSMQENRTAGIAAERLQSAGYEVTDGWKDRSSRGTPQW
jgi:metal-dependent amidase/aminoacylase/carboxypeptidase family protein